MIQTVDVFCRVIDNFGDAGVCWRLSRQLVNEHHLLVRLWIDRPETLAAFVLTDSEDDGLVRNGLIKICRLQEASFQAQPADIVIETFGCDVPIEFAERMTERIPPSLWVNLEYLSAEDWVEGCHALPSPHPHLPITRWFFFPGFSQKTGGLLREQDLLKKRKKIQIDAQKMQELADQIDPIRVSIFCYDHPLVDALFDAFEQHHETTGRKTECLIFQSPLQRRANDWIATHPEHATSIVFLPWLTQDQFDEVLWNCDFNVVRGEDSFVRAQWAGRPFLWDIYPTEDDAHLVKMAAFLRHYREGWLETEAGKLLGKLWQPWVRREPHALSEAWMQLIQVLPSLTTQAELWCDRLSSQSDLTTSLLKLALEKRAHRH